MGGRHARERASGLQDRAVRRGISTVGIVCLAAIGLLSPAGAAAVSEVPVSTGATTNAAVRAIVHDEASGYTYIGGLFTQVCDRDGANCVKRLSIARLEPDGSLDPSWATEYNDQVNLGPVNALALSDGGGVLYAGGLFGGAGPNRTNLAAFDSATGAATDFDPDPNGDVFSLAVLNGGASTVVYAGGNFTSIGGQSRQNLAKLDIDGAANPTFAEADDWVRSVAATGTHLLAGGAFENIGPEIGVDDEAIPFLAAVGTGSEEVDTAFNPAANDQVWSLATGDAWFAGGDFTEVDSATRGKVAALLTDGSALQWAPNANATVGALATAPDAVYAGGTFSSIGGESRSRLAELDTFLTLGGATAWNPEPNSEVLALDVSADGDTVFAGGSFNQVGGLPTGQFAVFGTPELTGPPSTAFAQVNVGSAGAFQPVAISNPGSGDLNVSALSLTGADAAQFELGGGCVGQPVPPGGSCNAQVRFKPGSAGSKQALLQVTSDAAGSPHQFALAGTAGAQPQPPAAKPKCKKGQKLVKGKCKKKKKKKKK